MSRLGVITFDRREDAGPSPPDQRHNVNAMRRCREVLAAGGAVCIFPEGVSHSDPGLRPFKAGPARIALDFLRKETGAGPLRIVPVGLLYTRKDHPRSDVWLRFGEPLDVGQWKTEHPDGDSESLTHELQRRVEEVALSFATRREAALVAWAAEIVATGGDMPSALGRPAASPADFFRLVARLRVGYRSLPESSRDELRRLSQRVRRYRQEIRRRGIEAAEVYLPLHAGRAALFVVRELELVVVGAPLALFGAINHLLPYLLVKGLARRLSKDQDHWASNIIYPGVVIGSLFYMVQLLAAWWWLPAGWALVYSVALPYTGYYALLYGDRFTAAFRRTRTFLYFLFHRSVQRRLAVEGCEIIAVIRSLGERAEAATTTQV